MLTSHTPANQKALSSNPVVAVRWLLSAVGESSNRVIYDAGLDHCAGTGTRGRPRRSAAHQPGWEQSRTCDSTHLRSWASRYRHLGAHATLTVSPLCARLNPARAGGEAGAGVPWLAVLSGSHALQQRSYVCAARDRGRQGYVDGDAPSRW